MAHPLHHAESSARKFGGCAEDYIDLHAWFDASKEHLAAFQHRALRHHAQGIFEAERVFGQAITNSDGRSVPVRFLGEQHVKEDCGGRIPSLGDWLGRIEPAPWMSIGHLGREEGDASDGSMETWQKEVANQQTVLGYCDWLARKGSAAPVRPFFECSTGHLSEATRHWLDHRGEEHATTTLLTGRYGWMVHVPEATPTDYPRDLAACIDAARHHGAHYALFDADADIVEGLPICDTDLAA